MSVPIPIDSQQTPPPQLTERQEVEWVLDQEYAAAMKFETATRGLLRFVMPRWAIEQLIDFAIIEYIHLAALRNISNAMDHPFKGDSSKTTLDLADLAVAKIHLAEAVPEMRASLVEMLETFEPYADDYVEDVAGPLIARCKAAIAKAEGR